MNAEDQKEVEINSLERWARKSYDSLSTKSVYGYVFVFGLIVLGILALSWWTGAQAGKKANTWIELDSLDTREKLKKFAEEHRGEVAAELARMRIARLDVGTEGLMKLGTRDAEQRKAALTNLVEGRKTFLEVVPQLKDSKSLQIEAWLGAAKAEETLIGASLEGQSSLGSADKAIEYYEKAIALLGESEEGEKLKKYLTDFKASKDKIVKDYTEFHAAMKPLEPLLKPEEKKEPAKKDEPKKDELKKDEPKKEEPKAPEVKKDEPKKDEPKKEEPKKTDAKKDEPKTPEKK